MSLRVALTARGSSEVVDFHSQSDVSVVLDRFGCKMLEKGDLWEVS